MSNVIIHQTEVFVSQLCLCWSAAHCWSIYFKMCLVTGVVGLKFETHLNFEQYRCVVSLWMSVTGACFFWRFAKTFHQPIFISVQICKPRQNWLISCVRARDRATSVSKSYFAGKNLTICWSELLSNSFFLLNRSQVWCEFQNSWQWMFWYVFNYFINCISTVLHHRHAAIIHLNFNILSR